MMKKEEAIDVIKDVKESFNENSWMFSEEEMAELNGAFNMAIDSLIELNWIPCSERLPIPEIEVLVTVSSAYQLYTGTGWMLPLSNNLWVVDNELRNDIVAWMPLPTSYIVE